MDENASDPDLLDVLMARARSGDEGAFSQLYETLYPLVWGFVGRRERQRQDAEDVVARTFHRLLERLDSFDPTRGSARVFVLAIARNLLIDDARSRRGRRYIPLDDVPLPDEHNPLAAMLRDEQLSVLHDQVSRLTQEEQDLLVLRFGDGLRLAEIAQLVGLREDAIRQRVSRLVRCLQTNATAVFANGALP